MTKKINSFKFGSFISQFFLITAALLYVHYTILQLLFKSSLEIFDILKIYVFLFLTVASFVYILTERSKKDNSKILKTFLILSMIKMGLVIVFLLPLFLVKNENSKIYIINFFIPYFIYLIFEIRYSLRLLNIKK